MPEPFQIYDEDSLLMTLSPSHETLYHLSYLKPDLSVPELALIRNALSPFLSQYKAEIRSFARDPADHQMVLNKMDLGSYTKYFYEKFLNEWLPPDLEAYQLKTLMEMGESDFLEAMILASSGDSLSEGQDPKSELLELKSQAGELYNPSHWSVVFYQRKPLGVILPQCFEDKPSEGTLFYVGVFPDFRGQGHGVKLHSLGLSQLKGRKCLRYIGSTGSTNKGMQRIFEKQSCHLKHELTFYTSG